MTDVKDIGGEVEVAGELSGMVTPAPPDWERMLAVLQDRPPEVRRRDTVRRRKAPWRWRVRNWLRMTLAGEVFVPVAVRLLRLIPGVTVAYGTLRGEVYRAAEHTVYDLGVMGYHLVTTAGKNYIANSFTNAVEPENLKYHGYGTGTTAAAAGDTALQTELTTQYNPDNTRPTGTQSNSTNTYVTSATLTPDAGGSIAITEWGLFSQAATGGGTLLDRQVFGVITLVGGSGDSLTTTYTFTVS